MNNYFVWRFSKEERYRVYGTKKYFEPTVSDIRCIWRGGSYYEALEIAKQANKFPNKPQHYLSFFDEGK